MIDITNIQNYTIIFQYTMEYDDIHIRWNLIKYKNTQYTKFLTRLQP